MKKIDRKELFTIPNLLSYLRIVLIPVFVILYLNAKTDADYYVAFAVVAVSSLSDLFDGMIARKLNQITELGKFLDPFADKLTQGALILCFVTRYPLMWLLVALYVVKEGFMAVMGLVMLKHNGKKLNGAMWFGKACTATLFVGMLILLVFPSLALPLVNAVIWVCAGVMLATLCLYIPVFVKMYREA